MDLNKWRLQAVQFVIVAIFAILQRAPRTIYMYVYILYTLNVMLWYFILNSNAETIDTKSKI